MSKDYSFDKEIRMEELFDGRLERFGVFEEVIAGDTSAEFRLLRKGCNGLWISGDEVIDAVTSPEENNPVNILSAILQTFDTCVYSDDEPQFWGFETPKEWDDALDEAARESLAELQKAGIVTRGTIMKIPEVIKVNTDEDSLTASFKLTIMLSDTDPLNLKIILDDEKLLIDAGHDEIDGDLDVIDCNGLIQFKQLVESSSSDTAFILGCPQQDGEFIQSIGITWCDERVTNARDQSLPVGPLHLLHFRASETSLMLFKVNNIGKDTPEEVWDKFCEIDPQLKSAGYLLAYSPSSNIIDHSSGVELTGSENFYFYCLVKNGADIPRYGRAFVKRSWLHGYGRIELTESGEYVEHQIVNLAAFHPNQTMCESPATLGDNLIQNRPGMRLHAGGLLDTEKLEDLNCIESLKYKDLVEEAKKPSKESWVQARPSGLKIKSS